MTRAAKKSPEKLEPREEATLFGLPAELPNRIYRLALVSPDTIALDGPNTSLPPLTLTNRQLYEETRKIYTDENSLGMLVFDLKLLFPIDVRHHWAHGTMISGDDRLFLHWGGDNKHWGNLKEWIRKAHEVGDQALYPGCSSETAPVEIRMAGQATSLMRELLDQNWGLMEPVLEGFKKGTELAEYQWA